MKYNTLLTSLQNKKVKHFAFFLFSGITTFMTKDGYSRRLADMKIKQNALADRLGVSKRGLQWALYQENGRYTAIIEMLEIMTEEQRNEFFGIAS